MHSPQRVPRCNAIAPDAPKKKPVSPKIITKLISLGRRARRNLSGDLNLSMGGGSPQNNWGSRSRYGGAPEPDE
jgi:hypothetical protein